jgi:glycosyltransferase involved in cell wall biosynthesis
MPVYNEEATVERAVEEVLSADLGVTRELVVVDDGSTDRTPWLLAAAASRHDVRLVSHDRNRGKGAALRSALEVAQGELATVFDADLEYSPDDIAPLLRPLSEGRANASFGIRAFDGYTSHSLRFVMGNKLVTLVANVLYDVYIHDLMTCHKMMRTELFRALPLRESGFAVEAEITARLLERGERIFETPTRYEARSFEEGKKLTWVDGLRVVRTLLRCRLRPAPGARRRAHGSRYANGRPSRFEERAERAAALNTRARRGEERHARTR